MKIFDLWFGGNKDPSGQSDRQLIAQIEGYLADPKSLRPERQKENTRARQAMLTLGTRPFSQEILKLAAREAGYGPIYNEARQALGSMGQPAATAVLIGLLKNPSGGYKRDVVPILGHPRNDCAVPALLKIALENNDYFVIDLSVKALHGIGTDNAKAALRTFQSRPSRKLNVIYFEATETAYTSGFGQAPTETELIEAAIGFPTYAFGSDAKIEEKINHFLTSPTFTGAGDLEYFLRKKQTDLYRGYLIAPADHPETRAERSITAYPSTRTSEAVRVLVARATANLPARQQFLRDRLTAERRAHVETIIGRRLEIP